ncbi:MAG: 50S ribosomal protein L18 [Eubacteriales bacterium]|nr:50S ribosomal protein L18 [Bacillota bacterium]
MINRPDRNVLRAKRHSRVRRKISGSVERPRLNIYRSLNNIYAQVIDDSRGVTLVSASTMSPELKEKHYNKCNKEAAVAVGGLLARKAREAGIAKVVFDRAGYVYHGRVKALADAAREGGLEF